MSTMRGGLGFVGLGRAAGRLATAANTIPGARIAAVASSDAAKAETFAADHGAARHYPSYDDLLADPEVTGVVIASANVGHLEQVTRAAAAGKHVFCEKPAGRNGSEAAQAVAACTRAGVTFGVGYHLRYHPLIRQAREAIAAGALGDVRLLRGHFHVGPQYDRSGWRSSAEQSGGGALVSTGVHVIDAFHFLAGDVTHNAHMICDALPVEEVCSAVLDLGRAGLGMFDTSRVIPNAAMSNDVEIFGERGRCVLSGVLGGWIPNGAGFIEADGERSELTTDLGLNLYAEEIADWIGAWDGGREPIADGASAIAAADAMDALYAHAAVLPRGTHATA